MNSMKYRGYAARIDYGDRDGVCVGRLLGIEDIAGFHAQRARPETRIRSARGHSRRSRAPQKPASGRFDAAHRPGGAPLCPITPQAQDKRLDQCAKSALDAAAHAQSRLKAVTNADWRYRPARPPGHMDR